MLGSRLAPRPRRRKDARSGDRRRLEYKRPVRYPDGAVAGYLDRWGNPWIVRVLGPNGWHWKEVYHGPHA
jgi:hypothetical protein